MDDYSSIKKEVISLAKKVKHISDDEIIIQDYVDLVAAKNYLNAILKRHKNNNEIF